MVYDVKYLVEIALSGTENFIASGEVNNIKLLDWTNKSLNDAVLKAGAQANVATDIDVRVTAVTKTGTENKKSFRCSNNQSNTLCCVQKSILRRSDATAAGSNTRIITKLFTEMHQIPVNFTSQENLEQICFSY